MTSLLFLSCLRAGSITVTYPGSGAVLNGPVNFTCSVDSLPVASVEFLLNGKRFAGPVQAPYSLAWHTGYAWNGSYTIEAVARDSSSHELARSAKVPFSISTNASSISVTGASPGATVSGVVTISPRVTLAPGRTLERFLIGADGVYGNPHYGLTGSDQFDTRTMRNGLHEFIVNAFDGTPLQSGAATFYLPVNVDNGHTLQEIRLTWNRMYLAPGAAAALAARAVYTDGQEQPQSSGVSFASANPAIARVDASGNVTGVASGVTQITVSALGKSTSATVYVDQQKGFAHFAKGGKIAYSFDPSSSLFLRTLFFLDPTQALAQSSGLGAEAQKAAVNALTTGLYANPVDSGQPADFPAWKKGWDSWWSTIVSGARTYNMGLFFTGDDIARSRQELLNSISGSYSAQAIQYAVGTARDSGQAIAMDVIDEASFLWGDNPAPSDNRWLTQQPAVPNDAFQRVMTILNGVTSRMPISWPIGGSAGGATAKNWFATTFSDYTSHYWTFFDNRFIYPWDASVSQYRANLDRTMDDRLQQIDRTRPMILLITATGNGYTKRGPGNTFTPGQDTIEVDGPTPLSVSAQIMYAVARGMAGVRVYGYDGPAWKAQRASAAAGTGSLQIGTDPFGEGKNRWSAMSAAFNLIKRLEPDLLQPQANSPDLGPGFVTGAKQGAGSRVLIAVNMTESPRTETVNFQNFLYQGETSAERYQLVESDMIADSVTATASAQQTFEPGQAVVWVFRPSTATPSLTPPGQPAVTPSAPSINVAVTLADSTSGATVRYTLDGSEPDVNSPYYTDPVPVSPPVQVKAKAFADGGPSATATAVISVQSPQPVTAPPAPATPTAQRTPNTTPAATPSAGPPIANGSLAAWWKLDEGAGAKGTDSSGNGDPVTLVNPKWSSSGCRGIVCLGFDGTSASGTSRLDLSASKTITVAFWLRWDKYANNDSLAMEMGAAPYGYASIDGGFLIDPNSSAKGGGQFEASMKGDAGFNQILIARPAAGVWHHFAFVLDKTAPAQNQIVPYVDGAPVSYTKLSNAANSNTFAHAPISLMSRLASSLYGVGAMADIRIYTRGLSPSEIQTLAK